MIKHTLYKNNKEPLPPLSGIPGSLLMHLKIDHIELLEGSAHYGGLHLAPTEGW